MVDAVSRLNERIADRSAVVGILGLGYVGLPLALAFIDAGYRVLGFDIDPARVDCLRAGQSGMGHIPSAGLATALARRAFEPTSDLRRLGEADAVLIAVPTPLTKQREPNLTFVESSAHSIAQCLRPGQLIVLESTTWPGTTREIVQPILEATGLKSGIDFGLAYSPEREDPGNTTHTARTVPKVVGADDPKSLRAATALYAVMTSQIVAVDTTSTAEAVKLTENIFRSVNIALVNELKMTFDRMGIDIWQVIEAAKTKPFGYMPFYPGPGLGGHCIPIDPFYLAWKAREFETTARFVELAGQINSSMPDYVVTKLVEALDRTASRGLNGARILIVGVSYKKNIEDTRESPGLKLVHLIEKRGAIVSYFDPFIAQIPKTREYGALAGRRGIEPTPEVIRSFDAVVVAIDHDSIDWANIADHGRLIVDTRNVMARNGLSRPHVFKA